MCRRREWSDRANELSRERAIIKAKRCAVLTWASDALWFNKAKVSVGLVAGPIECKFVRHAADFRQNAMTRSPMPSHKSGVPLGKDDGNRQ